MSLSLGGNQAIAEKIVCDRLVCDSLVSNVIIAPNINTQVFTLSTLATQSFTCFNANYANYDITVNVDNTTYTSISINCLYNGVNTNDWDYISTEMPVSGPVVTASLTTPNAFITYTVGTTGLPNDVVAFTLYNPFLVTKTFLRSTNIVGGGDLLGNIIVNGYVNSIASFNELQLIFSAPILGGSLSVRGFN